MKSKHPSHAPARPDDANAFLPEPSTGLHARSSDAEHFGEEFVASALTGESCNEDARDEVLEDEEGGGFHILGDEEMALTVGGSGLDLDMPESHDGSVVHEQVMRGGRWAARGV